MASWWNKQWDRLTGKLPPVEKQLAPPEPAKWLPAEHGGNPFGVPLLDLMLTQTFISTTSVAANATKAVSWQASLGDELKPQAVLETAPLKCQLEFPAATSLPDGILYAPPAMDQKWVLAWRNGHIIAARSWTGDVEAVAEARHEGESLRVERLWVTEHSHLRMGALPATFDWLIRSHALGQRIPFPLGDEDIPLFEAVPATAFSAFGNVIFCAARTWSPPALTKPLRSNGRVIRAAFRDDAAAITLAVEAGENVDSPSTYDGRTALHIAIERGNFKLYEHLRALGANPATLTDRGNSALGIAVVNSAPAAIFEALANDQKSLAIANKDGFTPMHGAAEVNNAAIVPWLVRHGLSLEDRTTHGHTPLHIACALEHVAAAEALLHAGADASATSPEGTPLDVARAEGKPKTIALLSSWKPAH
jgi:hypothetical protein